MRYPIRRGHPPALLSLAFAAALAACGGGGDETQAAGEAGAAASAADSIAFQNAISPPPPNWNGPVFQLSANYPTSAPPACPASVCTWLEVPVNFSSTSWAQWAAYLEAVLLYAVQGQTADLNNATGWQATVNGATRWFHVPWMAYDSVHGREFIHGTTNERTATLRNFVDSTTAGARRARNAHVPVVLGVNSLPEATGADTLFETWAVGMYNDYGGYAVGQAVPRASGVPRANQAGTAMPVRFPQGSVVIKLLFTTADSTQVSYLAGSPTWTVDRHVQVNGVARAPGPVHLVQVDVAARDDRSPIGWVYGTFAYNGTLPRNLPWWRRLSAVGVQWGSDPNTWPAVPQASSKPISQSVLSPTIDIYEHDGCNGRLAGPVDNPLSSCTSCHGAAYAPSPVGTPATSSNSVPIFGFPTECQAADSSNAAYFSNTRYPDPYPPFPGVSGPSINLDTSLQLQVAYQQYANWLQVNDAAAAKR